MKIYVASFYDTKERLRPVITQINQTSRHIVISSWIKEPHTGDHALELTDSLRRFYAWRDLDEIQACDLLLLDTFDVTPRGGREFEAGYAYALGKEVWLVGPERSVFHKFLQLRFSGWPEVLDVLRQL